MSERRMPAARALSARPQRRGSLLSTVVAAAVTAVIVASAATAFLLEQTDTNALQLAMLEPGPAPAPAIEDAKPPQDRDVVTAPPLNRRLPLLSSAGEVTQAPATNLLGASATCPNCGVVETVVAVHAYGEAQARAYQMQIRMDNGSVRTVEHRGALAAGSRVVVEGGRVRPVPAPS